MRKIIPLDLLDRNSLSTLFKFGDGTKGRMRSTFRAEDITNDFTIYLHFNFDGVRFERFFDVDSKSKPIFLKAAIPFMIASMIYH